MTKLRYLIAKTFYYFGIKRTQKRLNDGAAELQLLHDAEDLLGRKVWRNLGEIEKYRPSYDALVEVHKEKDSLQSKIVEIQQTIEQLKNQAGEKTVEPLQVEVVEGSSKDAVSIATRDLYRFRSKLGILDSKASEYYSAIGRDVSKERYTDKACREATKERAGLCKLMQALKKSVGYNYELSGRH